jgi:hypothetical protein
VKIDLHVLHSKLELGNDRVLDGQAFQTKKGGGKRLHKNSFSFLFSAVTQYKVEQFVDDRLPYKQFFLTYTA